MDLFRYSRVHLRICGPSRFCRVFGEQGYSEGLIFAFLFGLESGIPVCCALEFCFRIHILKQRGIGTMVCGKELFECPWLNHFPCWWHRRKYAEWFYPSGVLTDAVWIPKECLER
jgi:hypothetical protein